MKRLDDQQQSVLFVVISAFFFALMNLLVKCAGPLPTMQKLFFRNAVCLAGACGALASAGELPVIPRRQWGDLFCRSFWGTVGVFCNFYAVDHMLISDASMLNKLSPFFAVLVSVPLLREKPKRADIAALFVVFCGTALIIKPSFHSGVFPGLVGLLGGAGAGTAYAYMRRLGTNGISGARIVFFFSAFSCMVSLPFMIWQYRPMTGLQLLYVLGGGGAGAAAQFAITKAYTKAPASKVSVYDYSQVLFAAVLGGIFLSEVPDRWSLLGYVIIIAAAAAKWRLERFQGRNPAAEPAASVPEQHLNPE